MELKALAIWRSGRSGDILRRKDERKRPKGAEEETVVCSRKYDFSATSGKIKRFDQSFLG